MTLLVIASGLYRLMAERMRGYADAQAREIFRGLIDTPAIGHRRRNRDRRELPPLAQPPFLTSGLLDQTVTVPLVEWPRVTLDHLSTRAAQI